MVGQAAIRPARWPGRRRHPGRQLTAEGNPPGCQLHNESCRGADAKPASDPPEPPPAYSQLHKRLQLIVDGRCQSSRQVTGWPVRSCSTLSRPALRRPPAAAVLAPATTRWLPEYRPYPETRQAMAKPLELTCTRRAYPPTSSERRLFASP